MRFTESFSPWFSPSAWLPQRLPQRPARRPWRRLSLEQLEGRIVPATDTLDVGGLRFLASDGFQSASGDHFVNTGTVSIGYTPVGLHDQFLPLIQAKALQDGGSIKNAFFTLMANQTFEIAHAELDLVVVGGTPSLPIPIWKSTDPGFTETFDIKELQKPPASCWREATANRSRSLTLISPSRHWFSITPAAVPPPKPR
jgi:hypothetical protein